MPLTFDDGMHMVREARTTIADGDMVIKRLANALRGRLRIVGVDWHTLTVLKRELRDFNVNTGKWKARP